MPSKVTFNVLHRTSLKARCRLPDWWVRDEYAFCTAESAWAHWVAEALSPDAAEYIIVAGHPTDEVDKYGARRVLADWTNTIDPQSFPSEIEGERQRAELIAKS